LGEAARRLLRSAELPATGGVPVTVLATITIADLRAAVGMPAPEAPPDPVPLGFGGVDVAALLTQGAGGLARLGHGQNISAKALLQMACDAKVIPVIFNETGGILAYGQRRRLASKGQRLALAARDGGCCYPGCDRPAAWCEVHHVVPWLLDGRTDLDNMILLCPFHHRHFEQAGWQVIMRDGRPWWIPPTWVDPDQRPCRNTTHHPADIVFRQPGVA
jgi:hypothetical protein